jgi:putative ABC transport system permease protein
LAAVGLLFHAELRRRWRAWLAIAVLISVVGGLVLAATAAGRRTQAAFPGFVAAHGFDAVVYATRPVPTIGRLAGVDEVTQVVQPDSGQATCTCARAIAAADLGVEVVSPKAISPFTLISGHLPDPSDPDQVLASFTLQQDYGVRIGTVIHVPFEAPSQAAAYNNPNTGLPKPHGPTVAFHVVGIEATEFEFPSGTTPVYLLYASPAFSRTVLPVTAKQYQYYVRLRRGAAGLPGFGVRADALRLGTGSVGYSSEDGLAATVEASIHPQAVGWWILAALAALVGLAVVAQALSRQSVVESEEYPTMAAIGIDRRQLFALGMTRTLVVGLAGAAGAVAIAFALSPIAPLGEARMAEASTGVAFDPLVLPLGAVAAVVAVLALGVWPALRASRTLWPADRSVITRPSPTVTRIAAMGAPPSAVIGVRNALERRSGGASVPLGSALLGVVLAVIALCGTGVFGASLSHLTATSALWGDPEQISFDPPNPALVHSLEHNKSVTAITEGVGGGEITVNKVVVGGIAGTAIKGRLLFSAVNGHLPETDDQIGLGVTTLHQVGAHVGSLVTVSVLTHAGTERTTRFHVVSQDSFPEIGGFVSLGTGALVTIAGLEHAFCTPGATLARCRLAMSRPSNGGIRVTFAPGPQGRAALDHYRAEYRDIATVPLTPTSLVNFGEAVNFPLIFGAMLAVFGAATLAHLLVVSVSRRRREVGLLKVLGFVNHQVVSTVAWQASTLALVGLVVGVPLGVVAGRAIWGTFADNLGVIPVSVVPTLLVVAIALGVMLVANLLAAVPALVATRSHPGDLMRSSSPKAG